MPFSDVIEQAQEYMVDQGLAGWLLYDYRGMNPILWETLGPVNHVTRPCWLWIPSQGAPRLLVSYVDQGRFSHLEIETAPRSTRAGSSTGPTVMWTKSTRS